MFREPEIATEDLITGDVLLNWIGNLDPTSRAKSGVTAINGTCPRRWC